MASPNTPIGPDTPVSVKITIENTNRRLKLKFSDLSPSVLPNKLKSELGFPDSFPIVFERWSDSAGCHITLDPAQPSTYKSLLRAAKSKFKLRLRATVPETFQQEQDSSRSTVLDMSALANALPSVPTLKPEAPISTSKEATTFRYPHSAGVSLTDKPQVVSVTSKVITPNAAASSSQRTLVEPQFPVHRFSPVSVPATASAPAPSWSVYCNACDKPMEDEHYHCDTCDNGDYDLCRRCVDAGIHCQGAAHWLIKRSIKDGQVVNSSTETLQPKNRSYPDLPGAFTEDKKTEVPEVRTVPEDEEATRTCNTCVMSLPEEDFVTCLDCEDYDLCITCHEENKHGHHPGHTFEPVSQDKQISAMAHYLCKAGRNARHSALCDGCDKPIYGVRYKCLSCPDWDYCSECYKNVKFIHDGHRFAPIYEPIAETRTLPARHFGIYCDGHLCKGKKEYISGVRYKCAICNDTDFCGNCEASPGMTHNKSHPLIMFKTPVRNVSITTHNEDNRGEVLNTMGDRPRVSPRSSVVQNANSGVQTIADLKPTEAVAVSRPKPKIEIKDLLAEPIEEKCTIEDVLVPTRAQRFGCSGYTGALRTVPADKPTELAAYYQRDTIRDGSIMTVGQQFTQVWTLVNPGPHAWPAGCSVRYIGGDNMLNVDDQNPSRTTLVNGAMESNVINKTVMVGEEVKFSVTMKAPSREGTAISYWRIKAPDGTPFGHRLWCHIQVVAPRAAPFGGFSPATVPTTERTEQVGRPSLHDQFMQVMMDHRTRQQQVQMMQQAQSAQQEQAKAMQQAQMQRMLQASQAQSAAELQMRSARMRQAQQATDAAMAVQQKSQQRTGVQLGSYIPFGNFQPSQEWAARRQQDMLSQTARQAQASHTELAGIEAKLVEVHAQAKAHADALQHARNELQNLAPSFMARARAASLAKEAAGVAATSRAASVVSELSASTSTVAPSASSATKPQPASVVDAPETESEGSQMIFPTLEKESPVASIHEADTTHPVEVPEVSSPAPTSTTLEFFEDAETIEAGDSSDDETFLTDDEYDILDASDEEHL